MPAERTVEKVGICCQRSTSDSRLILGKGYTLVVLGGYGRTDPLHKQALLSQWSSGWDSDMARCPEGVIGALIRYLTSPFIPMWFESEGVDCLTERGELNPYVYDVSALDCFHPVLIAVVFPCVAGNRRKPPPELTLKWISKAWKAVPKELIQRSFITCGISNALDGSQDNLCMQHRRDAVKGEVELDDEIATDGFCCNNVEEPESDGEADQDGSATVDGDA
ncbi:unnamed protein product [Closterium sp. NIES-54]